MIDSVIDGSHINLNSAPPEQWTPRATQREPGHRPVVLTAQLRDAHCEDFTPQPSGIRILSARFDILDRRAATTLSRHSRSRP